MAFFEIWKGMIKGKLIPKVSRWLRASTLDCWPLCFWFTGSGRWPDRWSVPVSPFGLWGGILSWWAPSLAWRFFCGSAMFLGPWRGQPALHHCGADFLVWISQAFGHSSVPLCLLGVRFSLSIRTCPWMQMKGSGEGTRVKHWSFIHPVCIWTSKLQRSTICASRLWGVQISSGEDVVQLIHGPHRGKPAMVLASLEHSRKTHKTWTLGKPL